MDAVVDGIANPGVAEQIKDAYRHLADTVKPASLARVTSVSFASPKGTTSVFGIMEHCGPSTMVLRAPTVVQDGIITLSFTEHSESLQSGIDEWPFWPPEAFISFSQQELVVLYADTPQRAKYAPVVIDCVAMAPVLLADYSACEDVDTERLPVLSWEPAVTELSTRPAPILHIAGETSFDLHFSGTAPQMATIPRTEKHKYLLPIIRTESGVVIRRGLRQIASNCSPAVADAVRASYAKAMDAAATDDASRPELVSLSVRQSGHSICAIGIVDASAPGAYVLRVPTILRNGTPVLSFTDAATLPLAEHDVWGLSYAEVFVDYAAQTPTILYVDMPRADRDAPLVVDCVSLQPILSSTFGSRSAIPYVSWSLLASGEKDAGRLPLLVLTNPLLSQPVVFIPFVSGMPQLEHLPPAWRDMLSR
jgi:hypothetical protein